MADRMRKQGGSNAAGNRPLSIDEMNTTQAGIMLQSTNDSRIHEMLPNVNQLNQKQIFNQTRVGGFNQTAVAPTNQLAQTQQNTQMRQTMFNGNFMTKLRQSNAGQNGYATQGSNAQYENQVSERDAASSFATNASGIGNQRIGTTNTSAANNQAHLFNLVNQRKTPNANNNNPQQQMMMTT